MQANLENSAVAQFSSVAQLCPTLCDPMNRSTPALPVHHQLSEFTQTHVHRVSDAIQPTHPLLSPSPPAPNPSQHQRIFQWVNSSHEVAKVLEFQLQHHSLQKNPKAAVATGLENVKFFTPIPKKGNAKECSNYHIIAPISYANKVMLKILQPRLQLYINQELPDVQTGFRKGRGTRDQIANIRCIIGKAREFQKNIYFCFTKDHNQLWKTFKVMEYQTTLPASWETYMQENLYWKRKT